MVNSVEYITPAVALKMSTLARALVIAMMHMPTLLNSNPPTYVRFALHNFRVNKKLSKLLPNEYLPISPNEALYDH